MTGAGQRRLMRLLLGAFLLTILILLYGCSPSAPKHPAAIASAHPLATQAGIEILKVAQSSRFGIRTQRTM